MLDEQINKEYIQAMKDKDSVKSSTLNFLRAQLKNIIIEKNNVKLTPRLLRAIIVLSQINTHIWYNESEARKGEDQDLEKLKLTHGINGIRNYAKNVILNEAGAKTGYDYKTDSLAADFKDWEVDLENME